MCKDQGANLTVVDGGKAWQTEQTQTQTVAWDFVKTILPCFSNQGIT
jgi:hypothetical protein